MALLMKIPIASFALIVGTMCVGEVVAGECSDRIEIEGKPYFPRTLCGGRTMEDFSSCTVVRLSFDLSADGSPHNIKALNEKGICGSFVRSARQALEKTEFSEGAIVSSCTTEYIFALQP
ncbi:hypothetical protein Q6D67_06325 [Haliea sp. E1-2-M8]|nr:hypothetical protein [Haliea sp. E1-2-M8]